MEVHPSALLWTAETQSTTRCARHTEAGAKYLVIFNFAENMTGPYGTLQQEHFDALNRFWNEVVQNSQR